MPKCLIIAFDSLDYFIVEAGNYPNLKQAEYGKVTINLKVLSTPQLWVSFITGQLPREHGVVSLRMDSWATDRVRIILRKLSLHKSRRMNKLLNILGIYKQFSKKDIKVPTIFDSLDSVVISVPGYNEEKINNELRYELLHKLRDPRDLIDFKKRVLSIFIDKRRRGLEFFENNECDIFMIHFYATDILQHAFWWDKTLINKLYQMADLTVKKFKEKIADRDTLVLVISDHGQKRGIHTRYGFYSLNRKLGLKEPRLTDFADIIRQVLGIPSERDREQIIRQLKGLGYV